MGDLQILAVYFLTEFMLLDFKLRCVCMWHFIRIHIGFMNFLRPEVSQSYASEPFSALLFFLSNPVKIIQILGMLIIPHKIKHYHGHLNWYNNTSYPCKWTLKWWKQDSCWDAPSEFCRSFSPPYHLTAWPKFLY